MKPVETGCLRRDGRLEPRDALTLKERAGATDPLDAICPYALEMPVAPSVAAEAAGVAINLDRIAGWFEDLAARHQLTLVEGAGGLLVPLTDTADTTHLIRKLRIPVLVVTRTSLGTINHTLLTCYWARQKRLSILGVVLNSPTGPPDPLDEANLEALAARLPTPLLGRVPYFPKASYDLSRASASLDVDRLLAHLGRP
jgi:dethiobiotin synthetase